MKQQFKSMTIYKLDVKEDILSLLGDIEEKIKDYIFSPPLPSEPSSIGFEKVIENHHLNLNGHLFFKVRSDSKLLPASVVNEYLRIKCDEIEQEQGYKPGRKQKMDIKEEVILTLLPKAFVVSKEDYVWIDVKNKRLIINNTSVSKLDDIISLLFKVFENINISPIYTELSPTGFMTSVISQKIEMPEYFSIENEFELKEQIEDGSTIKYKRYGIDNEDILNHINNGKVCVQLSLSWQDKISFSLIDSMQIKQIKYMDLVESDKGEENDYESSLTLESMSLSNLIDELLEYCLGGIKDD